MYLREIFGYQEGTHCFTGIADCELDKEFDETEALRVVWNDQERLVHADSLFLTGFFNSI